MMRLPSLLPIAAAAVAGLALCGPVVAETAGAPPKFVASEQAGEMSHSSLIGLKIKNSAGEIIGDINYLVIDPKGQVTTVVVGVGGLLGLAEKNVGVPFQALSISLDGNRNLQASLNTTKDALQAAPAFTWTEKSTMEKVKERAKDLSEKAQEKAKELSEKAKETASEVKEKMQSK